MVKPLHYSFNLKQRWNLKIHLLQIFRNLFWTHRAVNLGKLWLCYKTIIVFIQCLDHFNNILVHYDNQFSPWMQAQLCSSPREQKLYRLYSCPVLGISQNLWQVSQNLASWSKLLDCQVSGLNIEDCSFKSSQLLTKNENLPLHLNTPLSIFERI